MLKNFILITFRSCTSQRIYTFINILGLTIGMACALLIAIYILHELSYDKFNKDSDQIYRVIVEGKLRGKDLNIALTSAPMAKALVDEFPSIESSTRIARFGAWLVSTGVIRYNEDNFMFADPNFFKFFSYNLIKGNPDSVLSKSRSIVLTNSCAKRYFGNEDPIGKKLFIETDTSLYTVTGLMEDAPSNSHFHFDIMGSINTLDKYLPNIWISHNVYTYVKTKEGTNYKVIEKDINSLVEKYVAPQVKEYLGLSMVSFNEGSHTIRYQLQSLKKIHLYSHLDNELEINGNALNIYSFGVIAILILIIACLNFMNLSTANSTNRAREVVLRKILGSERKHIIFQFLTESVVFSFIALIFAFLFAELAMPYFNRYLNISMGFSVINNVTTILVIIFFTLILGLLAGSYPAFFISSYEPMKILHGVLNKGVKNRRIRAVFVVFQFSVSILIIIMSLVVFAQIDYMLNKDLGFVKERVLVIRRPDALKGEIDNFKKEILRFPNIESVANSNSIPGRDFQSSTFTIEGDSAIENILMNHIFVNYDFQKAFGLSLSEGRFFSPSIDSDSSACVINETAARTIKLSKITGRLLNMPGFTRKEGKKFQIIGIVKDFNFETVDKEIEPLVILIMPGNWEGYLNVRINANNVDKTIKHLENTWSKYTKEYPFLYFFLDQDYDQNYRSVIRTGRVLLIFSFLSIFLACLGLFGLISFTSNQQIREIGIRKAVGATYYQIIFFLIKESLLLILIASFFAWGAAYLFSKIWLKDFYTRVTLSPMYFILASFIALALALLVVLYQSYMAARRDPGIALKAE